MTTHDDGAAAIAREVESAEVDEVRRRAVEYLSTDEAQASGVLAEVNRLFLHPLGLALAADGGRTPIDGAFVILDGRDDPEGFVFGDVDDDLREKAFNVAKALVPRAAARMRSLGCVVQPLEASPDVTVPLGVTRCQPFDEPLPMTLPPELKRVDL